MTSPYEELPQAPQSGEGPFQPQRPAMEPPSTVNNAFRLMLLRVALGIISVIVTFATANDIKQRIRAANPNVSNSSLSAGIAVGVVIGLAILVFYLFLAFKVRAGANWARIVTWVFAGLGVLGLLLSFAQATTSLARTFSIVEGLLDAVIIILLAMGPSNQYFRRR